MGLDKLARWIKIFGLIFFKYFSIDLTETIFKSFFIGSTLGLVLVYFIRFYSLANNGIKSGYLKINYSIDESAYLLGYSKFKTFKKACVRNHIPVFY